MSDKPLVTVITLVYNSGTYVIKALESLRAQTFFDKVENIIIDDCSKDNSVELVREWIAANDHACTFIANEENRGIPKNINKALSLAKGKYYTMLCDDIWLPNYLEDQLTRIEKADDDVALIFSDMNEIDQHGKITHPSYLQKRGFDPENIKEGYVFDDILKLSFIPAIATIVKNSVLDEIGMYDERLISEDYDMWLRITKKFKVIYNADRLVQYRRHPSSFTVSGNYSLAPTKLMIFKKHWGESPQNDQLILQKVKPLVYKCFKQGDKALAMEWAQRIIKNSSPGFGFKLFYYLQRRDTSPRLLDFLYRVFVKLDLLNFK